MSQPTQQDPQPELDPDELIDITLKPVENSGDNPARATVTRAAFADVWKGLGWSEAKPENAEPAADPQPDTAAVPPRNSATRTTATPPPAATA